MSSRITTFAAAALCTLACAATSAAQTILQGPVFNPATGSRYYLLQTPSWTDAQAFARARGGDLATINNAAENEFLRTTFAVPGDRKIFIGLSDARVEGAFEWSDGSTAAYRNWAPGEPSSDDFAHLASSGTWFARSAVFTNTALMEISGPIRVPREHPTIAAAAAALPTSGTNTILVDPGVHQVNVILPAGEIIIRGAARDSTTLNASGSSGFNLAGSAQGSTRLRLESVTVTASRNVPFLFTTNAQMSAFDCRFDFSNIAATAAALFANSIGNYSLTLDNCHVRTSGVFVRGSQFSGGRFDILLRNTVVATRVFDDGSSVFPAAINSTIVGIAPPSFFTFHSLQLTNSILALPPGVIADVNAVHSLLPGQDPRFVNPAANDFRLRPDSPAINAANFDALLAAAAPVTLDAAMNSRVVGSAPDMGALERSPQDVICPADFNNDNMLDINDFFAYLAAYSAGCP